MYQCGQSNDGTEIAVTSKPQCAEFIAFVDDTDALSISALAGIERKLVLIHDPTIGFKSWWLGKGLGRIEIPAYSGWEEGWEPYAAMIFVHEAMHFVFEEAYLRGSVVSLISGARFTMLSEGMAEVAEGACVVGFDRPATLPAEEFERAIRQAFSERGGLSPFEAALPVRSAISAYLGSSPQRDAETCERAFEIARNEGREIDADRLIEIAHEIRRMTTKVAAHPDNRAAP
ncbi:hypothetical protein GCM10007148_28350 [Parvularcula lutaonensis]|nr:hypothetical protein GCM10007148_28350 [Parvularcula lutaonensis]